MGARIIDLAEVKARRACAPHAMSLPGFDSVEASASERFHFWTGQSGKRYVHTVYSLIECPAVPAGNYVLVNRDAQGRRTALSFGRTSYRAPSLNLAEIRQLGASLGANEVHIHLLAGTAGERLFLEADLRNGTPATVHTAADRAVGQSHH